MVAYITRAISDSYVVYFNHSFEKNTQGLKNYALYIAPFIFIFSEILPACLMLWNHHITFSAVEKATSQRETTREKFMESLKHESSVVPNFDNLPARTCSLKSSTIPEIMSDEDIEYDLGSYLSPKNNNLDSSFASSIN